MALSTRLRTSSVSSVALPCSQTPVADDSAPSYPRSTCLSMARGRQSRTTSVTMRDRKSTRLNSSHLVISYAVFCLKKKKKKHVVITSIVEIIKLKYPLINTNINILFALSHIYNITNTLHKVTSRSLGLDE